MVSQHPQPSGGRFWYGRSRLWALNRVAVNVVLDGFLAAIAAPIAHWLATPQAGLLHPLWFLAGAVISLVISGLPFRVPQQYWRFSGISDLLGIIGASVASAILFSLALWVFHVSPPSPAFGIIYAMVLLVMLGGARVAYRVLYGRVPYWAARQRIVLIGDDAVVDLYMRVFERNLLAGTRVAGIVAVGGHRQGQRIHNVPILGNVADIQSILERLSRGRHQPDTLVVTDPAFRGSQLTAVLDAASARGIAVLRAPALTDLTPAEQVRLRPIPLEDLLNRPQVRLDRAGMEGMIAGRVVLVTGAGGTIGSELARQIAGLRPARLVLLDHGEFALWQISMELSRTAADIQRESLVADVRDETRLDMIMADYKPDLVFHAAALKHVPIVEHNPTEGLLTNIHGTRVVADTAARHGVRAMVVISTDKAVNPSSLMGASKRAAEMYCQALDIGARASGNPMAMRCITVRFGNVLGSTGSVVPLFRQQLERGGPLTVTHPDMCRYFMTVPEAVGLVLQAAVRGTQGLADWDGGSRMASGTDKLLDDGGIFVLDMGEPVRIVDLARQMIYLAGLRPDEDVAIEFTGLRPGEKLCEELFHGREAPVPTDASGLLMATPRVVDREAVTRAVNDITRCAQHNDVEAALRILALLVPEFDHNPEGEARTAVRNIAAEQPAGVVAQGAVKDVQTQPEDGVQGKA